LGGVAGIVTLEEDRIGEGAGSSPFHGSGVLLLVGESLPIFLFIFVAIMLRAIV